MFLFIKAELDIICIFQEMTRCIRKNNYVAHHSGHLNCVTDIQIKIYFKTIILE